ncbi:tRNA (guanine(37)-N1)-methyltransferase [Gryllus bimaculatus]|nr:tRNA (guanine(37)-N1)-methyltransferase [Gryllus bimaculatus]
MFVCEELMRTSFFRRVLTCKYSFHLFKVCKMNSHTVKDPTQFLPPSEVRGMKSLDKEKFNKFIIVPWLEIDEQLVGGAMSILKKYLMKVLNIKPLRPAFELLDGEEIVSPPVDSVLMELLAGIENMVTRTREHGCLYELDFSTVYWNPRLCTEHERITSKLESGCVLYDVFAGVGPFSIPAGKKKCNVLANDLNPESYKWLNVNCRLNKVQQFVKTFNKDGRKFIKEDIKKDIVEKLKNSKFKASIHITMNLPASAVTFLSAFHGLLCDIDELSWKTCPIVHVYCFVGGENPKVDAQTLVEENLGSQLDENLIEVFYVRNVAPNKEMMRVSFKLSNAVLTARNNSCEKHSAPEVNEEAPSHKRICLSSENKETMGKKNNSNTKKVFKVAGSKALKAKKKAKAVQGQLKKVAEMNRKKIAQVDKQLSDIHDELRHGSRKETNKIKKVVQNKKPNTSNIEISAMDKLDQLKM